MGTCNAVNVLVRALALGLNRRRTGHDEHEAAAALRAEAAADDESVCVAMVRCLNKRACCTRSHEQGTAHTGSEKPQFRHEAQAGC